MTEKETKSAMKKQKLKNITVVPNDNRYDKPMINPYRKLKRQRDRSTEKWMNSISLVNMEKINFSMKLNNRNATKYHLGYRCTFDNYTSI